jgi:4-hydroxybenzoate polyprenyltransferase
LSSRTSRSIVVLLHYWWPLALAWSTTLVVHRATSRSNDPVGLMVLMLGVLAAYSLDRAIDATESQPEWMTWGLAAVGAFAACGCAALLADLPMQTAAIVPLLGLLATGYSYAKRWPLFKTLVVPIVWTWAVIALPFHDGSWFGWRWIAAPIALPLLLLIGSGCVLCDLKDEWRDRRHGVASIAARFGGHVAARAAIVLALLAAAVALAEQRPGLAISALVLVALSLKPSLIARDAVGPLLVDATLTIPGVLIAMRVV